MVIGKEEKIFYVSLTAVFVDVFTHDGITYCSYQNNLNVDHVMNSGMCFASIENWQILRGREGSGEIV